MEKLVRIRAVNHLDGFHVRLTFTDGSEREVDLKPYLSGPIFEPLVRDPSLFSAVHVDAGLGTIVWPNGADIDPDVLYHGREPASWQRRPRAERSLRNERLRRALIEDSTGVRVDVLRSVDSNSKRR